MFEGIPARASMLIGLEQSVEVVVTDGWPDAWAQCKEIWIQEYDLVINMDCGHQLRFESADEVRALPIKGILCSCGDESHWFILFIRHRENKFANFMPMAKDEKSKIK